MTTTFNLSSSDYAVHRRSQLRLLIGDATENDGPRPGQANFQDNELDEILSMETDDLNRATARAFEILAGQWARYAGNYRLGPESEEMRQSTAFADRAAAIRAIYGFTTADNDGGEADSAFVDWSSVYTDWVGKF